MKKETHTKGNTESRKGPSVPMHYFQAQVVLTAQKMQTEIVHDILNDRVTMSCCFQGLN